MLKNRRLDLVLTAPPLRQIGIECTTIFNEQPIVIYPDGHWLAQHNSISIEDLADEAFVGVPEGYGARDCMNKHFARFGINPNYAIETSETVSAARFVKKGFGIAIVPKSAVLSNSIPQSNAIELQEDLPCPVALSWREGYALNENEKLFVDAALSYFNESAAPLLHSTAKLLSSGEHD